GPDGICEAAAGADETQVIPVGQGTPDSICVSAGADATLDTAAPSGDDVVDVPNNRITSGPDGVCDTTADMNDVQSLPVGQGTPNSVCITADNPLVRNRNVRIQNLGIRSPSGFDGIHVDRSDFVEINAIIIDGTLGPPGLPATGRHGVFVDARSVKPVVKASTARFLSGSGFLNQGPGAEVSTSLAEFNFGFGFLQQLTSGGAASNALYNGNTALANTSGGFGTGGITNIFQRCLAFQNTGPGFVLGGVGHILFQVNSSGNSIGVEGRGVGLRIRSSQISSNLDAGILLLMQGDDTAVGSEVYGNTIFGNRNVGVRINVPGVVMRRNQIGPRKLSLPVPQDVGVLLQSGAEGTLLELNKLQNNFDTDGNVCPPAGTACDLVNGGMNNAGRLNTFNDGYVPPPGFVD
ncbi:MAG: right-handed parallel beta-helix repeat-containing protein, partial [Deltaproteobacteria bacterium]|nr:right-handed parallel beta-helix repeat-containing protein [Deltaproteobacteria bacterium]